ncbi:hypothetical protein QFC19_004778, partial [Naganishia cerealis]
SEESFHSAVKATPTQSIESGGIRLYPNQSFPQSVSVSFEEVFCDAPGASAGLMVPEVSIARFGVNTLDTGRTLTKFVCSGAACEPGYSLASNNNTCIAE